MNEVGGSSVEEAAQEVQEESKEESPGMEATCSTQMWTDLDPFVEIPGSTTDPSSEPVGGTQEMDFN